MTEIKGLEDNKNPSKQIGFVIFSLNQKEDRITTMNTKKIICNTKSTNNESFVQIYRKLSKGRYIIIPFSTLKEEDIYTNLEIYYTCQNHQIRFDNKTMKNEKIIEKVDENETIDTNPVEI